MQIEDLKVSMSEVNIDQYNETSCGATSKEMVLISTILISSKQGR